MKSCDKNLLTTQVTHSLDIALVFLNVGKKLDNFTKILMEVRWHTVYAKIKLTFIVTEESSSCTVNGHQ